MQWPGGAAARHRRAPSLRPRGGRPRSAGDPQAACPAFPHGGLPPLLSQRANGRAPRWQPLSVVDLDQWVAGPGARPVEAGWIPAVPDARGGAGGRRASEATRPGEFVSARRRPRQRGRRPHLSMRLFSELAVATRQPLRFEIGATGDLPRERASR